MMLFIEGKMYFNYQMAEQALYLSTNYLFGLIIIIEVGHLNVFKSIYDVALFAIKKAFTKQ